MKTNQPFYRLPFFLFVVVALLIQPFFAFASPTQDSPALGPADAPVQVNLYYDFQCGFCGKTAPVLRQVVSEYGDLVRFVAINVPGPGHAYAEPSAEFALTARDQGKFWEAFDLLFQNQSKLANPDLLIHAKTLGLDSALVQKNLEIHAHRGTIKRDFYHALDIGLTATPTIFIGGDKHVGVFAANDLRYYINEELAKKKIESPVGPVPKPAPKQAKPKDGVPKNMIYPVKVQKPVDSVLKVKVGQKAPDFTLPALGGSEVSLADYRGKKRVVLSFVPAAWTPVCSEQWPEYNESRGFLEEHETMLIGISTDNLPSLYSWTGTMGDLWFPVASDFYPHGQVATSFGVLRSSGVAERAVILIDKSGVIRFIEVYDINSKPDFEKLKTALEQLQ